MDRYVTCLRGFKLRVGDSSALTLSLGVRTGPGGKPLLLSFGCLALSMPLSPSATPGCPHMPVLARAHPWNGQG